MVVDPLKYFNDGWNCAESVLLTFNEALKDESLKAALGSALGGGGAHNLSLCGALNGGLIVLGGFYDRKSSGDRNYYRHIHGKAQVLIDRFREKHGSLECASLTGYNSLQSESDLQKFKSDKARRGKCEQYVQDVALIVAEIIEAEPEKIKNS